MSAFTMSAHERVDFLADIHVAILAVERDDATACGGFSPGTDRAWKRFAAAPMHLPAGALAGYSGSNHAQAPIWGGHDILRRYRLPEAGPPCP